MMNKLHKGVLLLSVVTFSIKGLLAAGDIPEYSCYHITTPPVMVVTTDDNGWRSLPETDAFFTIGGKDYAIERRTYFRAAWTDDCLYIYVKCFEPMIEKILAAAVDGGNLWEDDSIEMFLQPVSGTRFHLIANSTGSRWNATNDKAVNTWNWEASPGKWEKGWLVKVCIPFDMLGETPKNGDTWLVNIARNSTTCPRNAESTTCWPPLQNGFHDFGRFGRFTFSAGAPAAQQAKKDEAQLNGKFHQYLKEQCAARIQSISEQAYLAAALENPDLATEAKPIKEVLSKLSHSQWRADADPDDMATMLTKLQKQIKIFSRAVKKMINTRESASKYAEDQVALRMKNHKTTADAKWFRGQLHAHTYWSDGRGFPEQAVDAYRQRGYDFLCITDHNRFAEDANTWRVVLEDEGSWPPEVSETIFDTYLQSFGQDWVDSRTEGQDILVRLKTYAEIKDKFEKAGDFILMPGIELTQTLNGFALHMNSINLPGTPPCVKGAKLVKDIKGSQTVSELIAVNASEVKQAAGELQNPYMLMLDHPLWTYYDIVPQNLIDNPGIRFFEVCNGGSDYVPHPQALTYTVEKFWDVVNAFRSIKGDPLLYGVGSDDAHFYDAKRINDNCGVGDAWVMVRAANLTPAHLIEAMQKGDFYASSGVLLNDVTFTPEEKTLHVKVDAEQGANYRIHFIATKKGFNQSMAEIAAPSEKDRLEHSRQAYSDEAARAGKNLEGTETAYLMGEKGRPSRTIPIYSDDIGRIVKSVKGTEATYRMEDDDLYVRARVESDIPSKVSVYLHPKVKMAWSQPYEGKDLNPKLQK